MNFGLGKVSEKSGNGTLIDIFGNEKCKVNFGFKYILLKRVISFKNTMKLSTDIS